MFRVKGLKQERCGLCDDLFDSIGVGGKGINFASLVPPPLELVVGDVLSSCGHRLSFPHCLFPFFHSVSPRLFAAALFSLHTVTPRCYRRVVRRAKQLSTGFRRATRFPAPLRTKTGGDVAFARVWHSDALHPVAKRLSWVLGLSYGSGRSTQNWYGSGQSD